MKLLLLNCASAKEAWANEAEDLYKKKISAFYPFEVKRLRGSKNSRENREQKVKVDSDNLLSELRSDDFVILFDERGLDEGSIHFSKRLQQVMNGGKKRIIFVIGGAFGVDDRIQKRADAKIKLSSWVFNHLVAEVVVLEQIYRALTIQQHIPYHNE